MRKKKKIRSWRMRPEKWVSPLCIHFEGTHNKLTLISASNSFYGQPFSYQWVQTVERATRWWGSVDLSEGRGGGGTKMFWLTVQQFRSKFSARSNVRDQTCKCETHVCSSLLVLASRGGTPNGPKLLMWDGAYCCGGSPLECSDGKEGAGKCVLTNN